MPKVSIGLLVLRTADIAKAIAFYAAVGLELVEEQHGTGPVHYASQLGDTVIEIFPDKPGTAPDRRNAGATMIGFQVENLDATLATLKPLDTAILTAPQQNTWGYRAVVQDPDGRAIELNQLASTR